MLMSAGTAIALASMATAYELPDNLRAIYDSHKVSLFLAVYRVCLQSFAGWHMLRLAI